MGLKPWHYSIYQRSCCCSHRRGDQKPQQAHQGRHGPQNLLHIQVSRDQEHRASGRLPRGHCRLRLQVGASSDSGQTADHTWDTAVSACWKKPEVKMSRGQLLMMSWAVAPDPRFSTFSNSRSLTKAYALVTDSWLRLTASKMTAVGSRFSK